LLEHVPCPIFAGEGGKEEKTAKGLRKKDKKTAGPRKQCGRAKTLLCRASRKKEGWQNSKRKRHTATYAKKKLCRQPKKSSRKWRPPVRLTQRKKGKKGGENSAGVNREIGPDTGNSK